MQPPPRIGDEGPGEGHGHPQPSPVIARADGAFAADLPLGDAPFAGTAGATWRCQVWFRDPVFGTGLSNSLVLAVR